MQKPKSAPCWLLVCLVVFSMFLTGHSFSLTTTGTTTRTRVVGSSSHRHVQQRRLLAAKTELENLETGFWDLVEGRAVNGQKAGSLVGTPHDVLGIAINVPLVLESLRTALTGQVDAEFYRFSAICVLGCAVAHQIMANEFERDYRAPLLAEYNSIYQFSTLYLIPFGWLLWRATPTFPSQLEVLDVPFCVGLSLVTLYGFLYAFYGKWLLREANKPGYQGPMVPSDTEYQEKAQLYLTGSVVINGLACLFLPFAWTLAIRGTEWWERVQSLHPNQAALMGVSILVAIVGDTSGNLLLRMQQFRFFQSEAAIVVCGVTSNILLLLFPEIIFHTLYSSGVSEFGFYWE